VCNVIAHQLTALSQLRIPANNVEVQPGGLTVRCHAVNSQAQNTVEGFKKMPGLPGTCVPGIFCRLSKGRIPQRPQHTVDNGCQYGYQRHFRMREIDTGEAYPGDPHPG